MNGMVELTESAAMNGGWFVTSVMGVAALAATTSCGWSWGKAYG